MLAGMATRSQLWCSVLLAPLLGCSPAPTGAEAEGGGSESETDSSTGDGDGDTGDGDGDTSDEEGFEPYPWPDESLSQYIDPSIGTGGNGYAVGTMNPGPALPFSMIKPGPDTGLGPVQIGFMNCTGYHWEQPHIWGFSHSRINGMGVPDYGAVQVMPSVGMDASKTTQGGARSLYEHEQEHSAAGYYSVELAELGVLAELTATTRAAHHRYTWDAPNAEATILFNLGYNPAEGLSDASEVEIDAQAGIIRGMSTVQGSYSKRFGGLPTYFVARVSAPIAAHGVWNEAGELTPGGASLAGIESGDIGAWLSFDLAAAPELGNSVELELAISYVSIEEAEQNLAELDEQDFEQTRAAAGAAWDELLARVRVLGGDEQQRSLFYSALYRSFLAPTLFSEGDGSYRGFDGEVHQAEAGREYYSDFSLWDTYRTTHPLFNLIARDRHADMLQSLVEMAEQGGDLPKWPLGIGYTGGMVGTSADTVLADAYLLGVRDFEVEAAYAAAKLHATQPRENAGRAGVEGFRERGWVASDEAGASASRTIEFSHADYALARWAEALGHAEDAEMFEASSHAWTQLWDEELGFLIGRRADGSFEREGFTELEWMPYYSEGTAHHYLWAPLHDSARLAELMGGEAEARARLLDYFETSAAFLNSGEYTPLMPTPYYWHSNEPSLHDAYLFNEFGAPAEAQRWVAWAREQHYGPGPSGLPGNDDAGTMSAWYVFASIGLYPLPGSGGYWLGAPTFERVELDLSDAQNPERRLAIIAEGAGPGAIYLSGASFNGEPLERPWLTWAQLAEAGGTLRLSLSDAPSDWGS